MTERKEKFTPGPWFIETAHVGDEKWDEIRDKDGNFIAESGNYPDSYPEPHPDSVLQKAAPEMYAALEGTLKCLDISGFEITIDGRELREIITNVMKKARGEE